MAQTSYTPLQVYSSSTGGNAPSAGNLTNSTLGSELAINIADGKLFYKDSGGNVQVIAWKTTPTTAGGTGLTSYTAGDLLYYATGTTLTKLAIGTSGQWLGSSGTAPQWNSPAALTKTDDTNVTLTLGGSASTALLNAASLTLGWTGQLAVTRGGTGLSSVAQGDILYASATNTLSALAKNITATRYLSNTGTSNNPAWAQIDLTNGVTGTLPVGNGGTGTATAFTAGSVVFAGASGVYSQNNSNFFWDNSNIRLGIGTPTPATPITVYRGSAANTYVRTQNTVADVDFGVDGGGTGIMWNNANKPLTFGTNGIQRAQIHASGGVSIGNTTDPGATNLYVSGTGYFGNNGNYGVGKVRIVHDDVQLTLRNDGTTTKYWQIGPYSSANTIIVYNQNNTGVYITDGGTSWTANSDERLKNVTGTYENALDDLMQIRPVKFTWKSDSGNKPCVGVIAQSVVPVVPEAIDKNAIPGSDDPTEYLGVRYTELIPILIASIQELKQKLKDAGVSGF